MLPTVQLSDDERLAPWNNGVFVLCIDNDGAPRCEAAEGAAAEISLDVSALTTLWSGRQTAQELHSWGLLQGEQPAVAKATAMFGTARAPHCFTGW